MGTAAVNTEGSMESRIAGASKVNGDFALGAAEGILKALGITGVDTAAATAEDATADLTGEALKMYEATQQGIKDGFAQQPAWYVNAPLWFRNGLVITTPPGSTVAPGTGPPPPRLPPLLDPDQNGIPGDQREGDTATSRFGRVLSRHNQLNGAIAGKRSIISGMRGSGLGSIDSDHLSGNAYDLTGQNLGAYQQLVQDSGGFAEFHNAGGRHLHVVPGVGGVPTGDTSTPVTAAATPTMVGDGSTYQFNITAGPNASPEAIAREVESIINKTTRSRKERR
jgi:hypothetical protein